MVPLSFIFQLIKSPGRLTGFLIFEAIVIIRLPDKGLMNYSSNSYYTRKNIEINCYLAIGQLESNGIFYFNDKKNDPILTVMLRYLM
jgi:hypothetical protein